MKKTLLWVVLLAACSFSAKAQTLIDVQFGGNDYGSPGVVQTGVGLIGSSGDQWNNFTSDSALISGVSLVDSTGASTGATLTVAGTPGGGYSYGQLYMYADGVNPGNPNGPNQLSANGSSVGNLASSELGNSTSLTLSLTGLTANTTYDLYMLSAPDRWERSSSWSLNGGTAQTVGPMNSYVGPLSNYPTYGWAPYEPVSGINYLLLTGTSDSSGNLTLSGTSISGDADINGFQLQAVAAVPEPSSYVLILAGVFALIIFQRKRASKLA